MGNVFTYDDLPQECVNTLSSLFASCLDTINDIEQVERTLMDKLFWSERPVIKTVSSGEPWVVSLLESIVEAASVVIPSTFVFLTKFDSYVEFLNQETWKLVKQLTGEPQPEEENDESTKKKNEDGNNDDDDDDENNFDVKLVDKEIIRQMEAAKEIENEISNQFIRIGMFQVNTLDIRNVLANKHRNIAERLRSDLALKVLHQSKKHDILFKKMHRKLSQNPENVEQVAELNEAISAAKLLIKQQEGSLESMSKLMNTLDSHKHESPESFRAYWFAKSWPKKLLEQVDVCEEVLLEKKSQYAAEQREEQAVFEMSLNSLEQEVQSFSMYTDIERVDVVAKHVKTLRTKINAAGVQAQEFNDREILFGKCCFFFLGGGYSHCYLHCYEYCSLYCSLYCYFVMSSILVPSYE